MLTDAALKRLKAKEKSYKVSDRDGMYAHVARTGTVSFRYDYRLHGRRETIVLGRYGPAGISLAVARELCLDARRLVAAGSSPAQEKQREKRRVRGLHRFGTWARRWLVEARMADSTRSMRTTILDRDILPAFKKRLLLEVKPEDVRALCGRVRDRGAPASAIHVRDIVRQIFAFAILHGEKLSNPTDEVAPSSIASFEPRDRALSPAEIRLMLVLLEQVPTLPTIRLGLRLILLTLVRKSELQDATWEEVDFESAVWSIPRERMKRSRPHNVYLSRQALDIMVALKTCSGGSRYLLPSRYDADAPMSRATFNRVTGAIIRRAGDQRLELGHFTVHDLRRTGATLLNELGFNRDWIEKCLAHEEGRSSRGVYNKAEYESQRRHMLQEWADTVDAWAQGVNRAPVLLPTDTAMLAPGLLF